MIQAALVPVAYAPSAGLSQPGSPYEGLLFLSALLVAFIVFLVLAAGLHDTLSAMTDRGRLRHLRAKRSIVVEQLRFLPQPARVRVGGAAYRAATVTDDGGQAARLQAEIEEIDRKIEQIQGKEGAGTR